MKKKKERREQPNRKTNSPMSRSTKNYTKKKKRKKKKKPDRQNPMTNGKSKAIQTKSQKVYSVNFEIIHCLFRYSTDAGYIKLIVEI